VGLIPGAIYPAVETTIGPGDKVVIYSDGVSEARGPRNKFYGVDRLLKVVRSMAKASCEELHDAILEDVRTFTQDTPQADDITLVVLEYHH
jgi:sigma-B regulation protein RsbU (phosphoserine phosphatase)